MRDFLISLLENYKQYSESELRFDKLPAFLNAKCDTIADAHKRLGNNTDIENRFVDLKRGLHLE